ncbi:MAG TPA: N-acetylmuramoyl-L-alanine amidase [Caulobacteraceae bacterium]|nr:N-acetylmuramoyl-L-alanine amidase [Caulobacteraceae bacterium]
MSSRIIPRLLKALFGEPKRAALTGVIAAAVGFGAVGAQGAPSGGVLKVRTGGDSQSTRVVVELDRSVKGKLLADAGDKVVVALPGVHPTADLQGRGAGLVKDWSVDHAAGAARVKLNLTRNAAVKRRFLLPPGDGVKVYRYVVDLEPVAATAAVVATKAVKAAPVPVRATSPKKPSRRVIVLDAGHGGKDPGASGAHVREKAITLAAAKALKAQLEKTGRYKVVLTRDADEYIPLETRVQIARKAGADLFLSLHADAGTDAAMRGASVYTLSDKGADRAAKKALGREDWLKDAAHTGKDASVNRILMDLTQRATKNRSAAFAKVLLEHVDDEAPLLRRSHRDAGFVVLLAPDVPAALLEMGFITNRDDEKLLTDAKRRNQLTAAVARAIDAYFEGETSYPSVAAAP